MRRKIRRSRSQSIGRNITYVQETGAFLTSRQRSRLSRGTISTRLLTASSCHSITVPLSRSMVAKCSSVTCPKEAQPSMGTALDELDELIAVYPGAQEMREAGV